MAWYEPLVKMYKNMKKTEKDLSEKVTWGDVINDKKWNLRIVSWNNEFPPLTAPCVKIIKGHKKDRSKLMSAARKIRRTGKAAYIELSDITKERLVSAYYNKL